jgi:hypothetical protein
VDLKTIINSPGMWIASSFIIIVVLIQSIVFCVKLLKQRIA